MTELVLGTAQWGTGYGITNNRGRLTDADVGDLVECAQRLGISQVDTAAGYGVAQERFRPWANTFRVTTKVAGADPENIDHAVEQALRALGVRNVDTILLHDWDACDTEVQVAAARALEAVRERGACSRVGVSIYEEGALTAAEQAFALLDVVQAPCNPLDRRLDGSATVARLASGGTCFQARSVFLQGLLIGSTTASVGGHPDIERFRVAAREAAISPIAFALAHVRAQGWVSEVVVGATSAAELEGIVAAWREGEAVPAPASLASADLDLIDPRRWQDAGLL